MVTQTLNNLSALPSKSIIFHYNFPKLLDFFSSYNSSVFKQNKPNIHIYKRIYA